MKASRKLGCGDLLLLTESDEGLEEESWHGMSGVVHRMPIADWLLASSLKGKYRATDFS